MKSYFIFFILLIISSVSCNNHSANNKQSKVAEDTIKAFRLPAIPPALQTPEARGYYLSEHYWDLFNFADTNYFHHPEVGEQAWVDYIDFLKITPSSTAKRSITYLYKKAEINKNVYNYFIKMADKYLYDPNSPMRNEELYISVLDVMLKSTILNNAEKIRQQERRRMAEKNRVGKKATNFSYNLASGRDKTLYGIKSKYTILFINNPGCHACEEILETFKKSPSINQEVRMKRLKILSIYPDQDINEWKNHLSIYPKEWICGYDKRLTIREKNLYDLKVIPTLYLLDQNKTVILKDANIGEIEIILIKNNQLENRKQSTN